MKRIVVLAILFLFCGAASALAQTPRESANAPDAVVSAPASSQPAGGATPRLFSKASIDEAVARSVATPTPQAKKPFLHTPWPWVIAGAVVVLLIVGFRGPRHPAI